MNSRLYYLTGKLLAALITAILLFETADTGILIIRMLVFGCLFALQLLLSLIQNGRYQKWGRLPQCGAIAWAFFIGVEQVFVIAAVVVMELLDELVSGSLFYEISSVLLLLLWFLYQPETVLLLFTLVFVALLLVIRLIEIKKQQLWSVNLEQREKLAQMQGKLEDMKVYARTIQDTAAMEERNRFAARIHDKLGHNISGSIILLEATALSMDKDPVRAKQNIKTVTENLRRGVDEIRAALRQERPERSRLGLHEVRKQLEAFQLTYGRKTRLETEGNLEKITIPLWICIQDNLKEALTNMLKHSQGDTFLLRICCMNKAIRVEYADNGACFYESPKEEAGDGRGMGLNAMEERAAALGGTMLVTGGQNGFQIVTVFILNGGEYDYGNHCG